MSEEEKLNQRINELEKELTEETALRCNLIQKMESLCQRSFEAGLKAKPARTPFVAWLDFRPAIEDNFKL